MKKKRYAFLFALALVACGVDPPTEPASTTQPTPASTAPSSATEGRTVVATARRRGKIEISPVTGIPLAVTELDNPRLVNDDPNAEVPLVLTVRRKLANWLEVDLPVRPNGSIGLVPAADFTLSSHNYRIEIALSGFRLQAFNGDDRIFDAPIGVAKDSTPTPGGNYYTIELVQPPDPNGAYGPYAFGLSGFSNVHETFAGGPGQLGIHGTNQPGLVGTKVSNGCIRLKNPDITRLVELGLPLGTPVHVRS